MKKKFLLILTFLFLVFSLGDASFVFGANGPEFQCEGLPGCETTDNNTDTKIEGFLTTLVTKLIQYVALIAVVSVMLGGLMYLLSGGEEEKVNKAKKWIIYSLAGVFVSIMAYGIISIINNISVTLQ